MAAGHGTRRGFAVRKQRRFTCSFFRTEAAWRSRACGMRSRRYLPQSYRAAREPEEILWATASPKCAIDFSLDGRFMSYIDSTSPGLWILPLQGERRPYRFYSSGSLQFHGLFSPDGKWIAYTPNETGRFRSIRAAVPGHG